MAAFISGFLNSYGQHQHEENLLSLQNEIERRKTMGATLQKLMTDPTVRPEHQQEYMRQWQVLNTTPYDKKLPKDIGNIGINLQPQNGQSLGPAPNPQPPSSLLPAQGPINVGPIGGDKVEANVPAQIIDPNSPPTVQSDPAPAQGTAPPVAVPIPPPPQGPFFTPAELGARAAQEQGPALEQRLQADVDVPFAARMREIQKFATLPPDQQRQYLMLQGKSGAMITPKPVNVLLKDGTQTTASELAQPGGINRYYDTQSNDITDKVSRVTGLTEAKDDIIRGEGGIPVGVRTKDGKEWYGNEPNIPREAGVMLAGAQQADEKAFTRRQQIQASAQAAAMARVIRSGQQASDKQIQGDALKDSRDALQAKEVWESAKSLAQNPTPRGDLGIVFDSVRSLVAGAGRMTNTEIQAELNAGSYGDRIQRAFKIASKGLLPDAQRQDLLNVIKTNYEGKAGVAGENWDFAFGNKKPRPPHLQLNGAIDSRPPGVNKTYNNTATDNYTGRQIGTDDDGLHWFDVQTGKPIR